MFLVDDDIMFAEFLKRSLKGDKTEIRTFPNGEECLKSVKEEDPEIVILDYYLNGDSRDAMNGLQVLNKIKHFKPDTKVIVLSAQRDVSVALDVIKYGAYDYVVKERSAFSKIKNDVNGICTHKEQTDELDREAISLKRLNIAVIVIVLIVFLLSRIF